MTVQELRDKLENFPEDARVCDMDGTELGVVLWATTHGTSDEWVEVW